MQNVDQLFDTYASEFKNSPFLKVQFQKDRQKLIIEALDKIILSLLAKDSLYDANEQLKKCLFLMEINQHLKINFTQQCLDLLNSPFINKSNRIFMLSLCEKYILMPIHKTGNPYPSSFYSTMTYNLLNYSFDPETLEWCIRLIERMNNSSIRLKNDVLRLKPKKIQCLFNRHLKNTRQLILYLEKRWNLLLPK